MPRQLPPLPNLDKGNRNRLNQVIDDVTALTDRGTMRQAANIGQNQLNRHKVGKVRLKGGESIAVRHSVGSIPASVSISPVTPGTAWVVRMTADRVYVRATQDMQAEIVIYG